MPAPNTQAKAILTVLDSVLKEIGYYRASANDPIISFIRTRINLDSSDNRFVESTQFNSVPDLPDDAPTYMLSQDIQGWEKENSYIEAFYHTLMTIVKAACAANMPNIPTDVLSDFSATSSPYSYTVFTPIQQESLRHLYRYRIYTRKALLTLKTVIKPNFLSVVGNYPTFTSVRKNVNYLSLLDYNCDNDTCISLQDYQALPENSIPTSVSSDTTSTDWGTFQTTDVSVPHSTPTTRGNTVTEEFTDTWYPEESYATADNFYDIDIAVQAFRRAISTIGHRDLASAESLPDESDEVEPEVPSMYDAPLPSEPYPGNFIRDWYPEQPTEPEAPLASDTNTHATIEERVSRGVPDVSFDGGLRPLNFEALSNSLSTMRDELTPAQARVSAARSILSATNIHAGHTSHNPNVLTYPNGMPAGNTVSLPTPTTVEIESRNRTLSTSAFSQQYGTYLPSDQLTDAEINATRPNANFPYG